MGAIADISAFLKMSPSSDIKCVAYMGAEARRGGQAGQLARRGGIPAR